MRPVFTCLLICAFALAACAPAAPATPTRAPQYDPFVPLNGDAPVSVPTSADGTEYAFPTPTEAPFLVPTAAPLKELIPTMRPAGVPLLTPTPDAPRVLPTARKDAEEYVVQAGDTLGSIAQAYNVSLEALMQANGLSDANLLEVGQTLVIPTQQVTALGSSFKIIPDSELVYGPASVNFDTADFINKRAGFLAAYGEEVNGEYLTAAQIVTRVAQNYSVNPRLLLALIDHRSGWVSNSTPGQIDYALGLADYTRPGLYLQLTYAANELNRGYYLWRANAVSSWVLADGAVAPLDPGINAGTAGLQSLFAKLDGREAWQNDVSAFGLYQTYFFLFGHSPFDYAVEPLVPSWLHQPRMALPFERGVTWVFTGGPHGGWDSGSGWAALDFSPVVDAQGCFTTDAWVTALTDGLIIRTGDGQVVQDVDGDGNEQTGWVILYMHIEWRDRVEPGAYVKGGQPIGHPSCEGGLSSATHLHLARKYNGEWIPADGHLPFILDGWTSSGAGVEYDGYLTRGDVTLEAIEGITELNMITR